MDFNYQLHSYRAVCHQWTGNNAEAICSFIENAELFREQYIVVRHEKGMDTLYIGDWVIKGEDGELRFYKDDVFPLKYRVIN